MHEPETSNPGSQKRKLKVKRATEDRGNKDNSETVPTQRPHKQVISSSGTAQASEAEIEAEKKEQLRLDLIRKEAKIKWRREHEAAQAREEAPPIVDALKEDERLA